MPPISPFFAPDLDDAETYDASADEQGEGGSYGVDVFGYETWDIADPWDSRNQGD